MLHIPLLRKGAPYRSLDVSRALHHRTREPFVEISQANSGLVRRDLMSQQKSRDVLAAFTCRKLLEICAGAARHFLEELLPLGEGMQSADDYVEQVSATTGLPYVLARKNMQKIGGALAQMESILNGLTRNLDLEVLDAGFGDLYGQALSFFPRAHSLGVVLPSNSPGVHSLWLPSIPLKVPLVLKPGSAEPWTPFRIAQALIRAGCPPEAFSYYPTDHAGAAEILGQCGRAMLFGDASTTAAWQGDPGVEIHGPGYSKIVIGQDCIDQWERYLDVLIASILENAGRSCVNASGVWVPSRGPEIAEALAERLAQVGPRDALDPQAQLAPFGDAGVAARICELIDQALEQPGARDVTASYRGETRLVTWQNCCYLLPTIIRCDSPEHALANREFLFPFASVVQVRPEELPERLGPSLVVTAITSDSRLIRRLLASPHVDRLNLGPIPTNQISWDQPHEGNLFEHLYARRAFQKAGVRGWGLGVRAR